MAVIGGLNNEKDLVNYGNRNDVCVLCRRDLSNKKGILDRIALDRELKGKLNGKKVVKIKHSGHDIVICMDHIRKLAQENPALDETAGE